MPRTHPLRATEFNINYLSDVSQIRASWPYTGLFSDQLEGQPASYSARAGRAQGRLQERSDHACLFIVYANLLNSPLPRVYFCLQTVEQCAHGNSEMCHLWVIWARVWWTSYLRMMVIASIITDNRIMWTSKTNKSLSKETSVIGVMKIRVKIRSCILNLYKMLILVSFSSTHRPPNLWKLIICPPIYLIQCQNLPKAPIFYDSYLPLTERIPCKRLLIEVFQCWSFLPSWVDWWLLTHLSEENKNGHDYRIDAVDLHALDQGPRTGIAPGDTSRRVW